MSKFTREQIDKARQLADHAFDETAHRNRQHDGDIVAGAMRRPGDEWIDTFTEALGLDVESEKPEPGTVWASPDGGFYLRIIEQPEGHDAWFIEDGRVLRSYSTPWQDLTPARVVPAEPVELSEAEVGELWGDWIGDLAELNGGYHPEASAHLTATVNAAIAKHGRGRQVTRDQVREVMKEALNRTVFILSDATIDSATDAVMELLAASK